MEETFRVTERQVRIIALALALALLLGLAVVVAVVPAKQGLDY